MAKTECASNNTIERVKQLLNENRTDEALQMATRSREQSPAMQNVRAVCLMRTGLAKEALAILTPMVFLHGSVAISHDAPLQAKINYATALLLTGNVAGCLVALREMQDEAHESLQQLRQGVAAWKKGQGFWRRLGMAVGITPFDAVVQLDYAPGAI